jgi:hypothetical protein
MRDSRYTAQELDIVGTFDNDQGTNATAHRQE